MYSQDEVTKLLEVQRESIMKVEAANNKLIVSGLLEMSKTFDEKTKKLRERFDMSKQKQIEIKAELDSIRESFLPFVGRSHGRHEPGDIDKIFDTWARGVEDMEEEDIHEAVLKIKTHVDARDPVLWNDWVIDTLGFGKYHKKPGVTPNTLAYYIIDIKPLDK